MRKRSEVGERRSASPPPPESEPEVEARRAPEPVEELVVPIDPLNEQAVLAAALGSGETRAALVRRVRTEHFLVPQHRAVWAALATLEREGVAPTREALLRAGEVDGLYLDELAEVAGADGATLDYHVSALLWDKQRALAVEGPIQELLAQIRDPRAAPEKVEALARRIVDTLSGHGSDKFVFDSKEVVRRQSAEIRERMAGKRFYPYGVDGLDLDENGERRIMIGMAPTKVTLLSGLSGSGKSTVAARIALGAIRQKRRVLYGAWEPGEGMTIELLACLSLGWSRTKLLSGKISEEDHATFEKRMMVLSEWVTFMDNPFFRKGSGKPSNERNLDMIEGAIAATRADVFVADLFERCLESEKPDDEKRALFRLQSIAKDLQAHVIALAQQRKDVEQRADKRPTREGIKGSGAWFEIADTLLGTHRPALWKKVDDCTLEVLVLKQRFGKWPLCVEFDWDPEKGAISNGRGIPFEHAGEASEIDRATTVGRKNVNVKKGGWRR